MNVRQDQRRPGPASKMALRPINISRWVTAGSSRVHPTGQINRAGAVHLPKCDAWLGAGAER